MAVPTGTFTTYAAAGNREDLSDVIYDISPVDTPLMSNVARDTATATKHEWQTDVLASATVNAQVEGDSPDADAAVATKRFSNECMISWKVPRVTGTQRAVNTAGRRDELSYQISKRGRELKRDIETALCGLQAATVGVAASARVTAGLGPWLFTNQVQIGSGQTTPAITSGSPTTAPTAGSANSATEDHLKTCIASCWDQGGDPTVILVGSTNKQKVSKYSGIATLYRDSQGIQPATIIGAADVYVSDFGQHQVVASRFTPATNNYVLDMEYICVSYLRPIQQETLSKNGDSDRRLILAEYCLTMKNPDASGKIYTTI